MRKVIVNHHYKPVHDYDLKDTGSRVELLRSSNNEWTSPGELAASIKDNGDHVKIKIGNKKIKLDYAELTELSILIQATEFPSFKIK